MNGCIYRSADNICKFWSKDGIESYCDSYSCEKKTPSNADRIRSMSDEELTELLYAWHLSTFHKKKEWIHNWLKKEVKDE